MDTLSRRGYVRSVTSNVSHMLKKKWQAEYGYILHSVVLKEIKLGSLIVFLSILSLCSFITFLSISKIFHVAKPYPPMKPYYIPWRFAKPFEYRDSKEPANWANDQGHPPRRNVIIGRCCPSLAGFAKLEVFKISNDDSHYCLLASLFGCVM